MRSITSIRQQRHVNAKLRGCLCNLGRGADLSLWRRSAVCGSSFGEVTIWDFLYAGSPCYVSVGPLPANVTNAVLYSCGNLPLYGKPCLGITDKVNLFFVRGDPSKPVALQMPAFLGPLGVASVSQVSSLSVYMYGAASPPIQPTVFTNLQFVAGDLFISGQVRTAPLPPTHRTSDPQMHLS